MQERSWNPNFIELSPIFNSFANLREYFSNQQCWPEPADLNKFCNSQNLKILTQSKKPICFAPQIQGKNAAEQCYESEIYLTGRIPTRTRNWHDFFNALVWQIFPRAKSVLNHLHYQAQLIELSNKASNRSKLRDAATLFDESGVVVVSSQVSLIQLIKDFAWKELFWRQRMTVLSSMRFFVFGHGLYEKALAPYTGMTGKGIIFSVTEAFFRQDLSAQLRTIDSMLDAHLSQLTTTADLTPIPLLGYPGWIEDNRNEIYYANKKYFRDRPDSRQIIEA